MDDFTFAGPEEFLEKGWGMIRKSGLKIEEPTGPGLFFGCAHGRFIETVGAREVRGFKYNMEAYLRDTVVR